MRIEDDIKLTFDDVLIRPKRSTLVSRAEVDLTRKFNFKYNIELEPSNNMVEVWFPIPQSNEVQEISDLNLTGYQNLTCKELKEEKHGNLYYYCTGQKLDNPTTLTLSANVIRYEHQTVPVSYTHLTLPTICSV